jgi:hypothetical protein
MSHDALILSLLHSLFEFSFEIPLSSFYHRFFNPGCKTLWKIKATENTSPIAAEAIELFSRFSSKDIVIV